MLNNRIADIISDYIKLVPCRTGFFYTQKFKDFFRMNNGKKVRGRPTKLSAEKIDLAIKLREKGFSIEEIAEALHVSEALLYLKGTEWSALRKKLNLIKEKQEQERINKVENSLYKKAIGQKVKTKREVLNQKTGKIVELTEVREISGDVKAQEFYLANRAPDRWSLTPNSDNGEESENDNKIIIQIDE